MKVVLGRGGRDRSKKCLFLALGRFMFPRAARAGKGFELNRSSSEGGGGRRSTPASSNTQTSCVFVPGGHLWKC